MKNLNSISFDHITGGLGSIVFEVIKIPFGIFDKDHKIVWANEAMASLHKMNKEELIGRVCHQVWHNSEEPCKDCPIEVAFKTGKVQIIEKRHQYPGRKKTWGEAHYYPIRGSDGEVAAIIVLGFDINDRKNRIEMLKSYSKYLSGKLNLKSGEYQEIQIGDGDISLNVKLSNREKEVLRMLTEGYTNVQISSILTISTNTVKTHVNNIFNKFGVNDRTQAAVIATRQDIV